MQRAVNPSVLYVSHISISVRYSWSVQTWLDTVKVKRSWVGRCPCSAIQRPIRRCHQKSGSCSTPTKRTRITIITPPSSSVRAERRSVTRKASAPSEGVRYVAGDASCIFGILAWKGLREDALLPTDAQQLADHEVSDRHRTQPAAGGDVDAEGRGYLAEIDGMPAQAVRAAGDQAAGLGDDRERAPQVGQAPDRVGEAGGGEQVAEEDQSVPPGAAGEEAGADCSEGAAEGDEDHGQAVVRAALGQANGVEDDQHREVGEGEQLLAHEEQVGGPADSMQPAAEQDQLPGEEKAEEQRGDKAAEREVPPVGSRAPLHRLCDAGSRHSRRNGISQVRPRSSQAAFWLMN